MIPIAGSAYTYAYATLGEIFAWIIGWDLILEYAVSNMAVAVGFSAYLQRSAATAYSMFHLPEGDREPDDCRTGARTVKLSFNVRRSPFLLLLTWVLVRGVRESAAYQQHHGRGSRSRPF